MTSLNRISDALRMSADALEGYYKERNGPPSTETAKLIKELRELTRENPDQSGFPQFQN
jgi:hypothetical protein